MSRVKTAKKNGASRKPAAKAPETSGERRIEQIQIADLVPYPRNPRTHSAANVKKLAASLAEYGWTSPVLINDRNEIIAGHGRVLAAKDLGQTAAPCIRLGHLSAAQVKAYRIADNRLGIDSEWDEEVLALTLEELKLEDDAFDNLGLTKSKGSGPARNFVWDHAVSRGFEWHWIVDDNIQRFYRWNDNLKVCVGDGTILRCMEDFTLRYSNIGMVGPAYEFFAPRSQKHPPFVFNTRIYSCNLIRHETGLRWRGRYNEDTDLSLRMLKAGFCTVLFNAFLQKKITTLTMKGGNTDELYANGTLAKSKMIVAMHPDICRLTMRFRRVHHYADYSKFKHLKLVRKEGVPIPTGIDNYGMKLVQLKGSDA